MRQPATIVNDSHRSESVRGTTAVATAETTAILTSSVESIRQVAYRQSVESDLAPPGLDQQLIRAVPPEQTVPDFASATTLQINEVLNSVTECYPVIEVIIGEIESAAGKLISTYGEFDTSFQAFSISQPMGFYQTYRNGLSIKQPLYGGGAVSLGYRIGDGNFEPWFGERETDEGGEFKTGFQLPLIKDRRIDQRRGEVQVAQLQRQQVESNTQSRLLLLQRLATQTYWEWVAAGRAIEIQQEILRLAELRAEQITERVRTGDLATIAQIDNDRFIATRKNELVKARRKFEQTSIKLSLFYRDKNCQPLIASTNQVPDSFPGSESLTEGELQTGIAQAISVRPEIAEIDALRRQVCVELRLADNLTLPKFDVAGFAGKDVGGLASSKGDKRPFELEVGLYGEVPLQRRKGRGKIRVAQGKLRQIDAKRRLLVDKITAEVRDAASAVNAADERIRLSTENVRLTRQSLNLGRIAFEDGDIDLIALNIYETAVQDAEFQLVAAQRDYLLFRAVYVTAIQSAGF